MRKKKEEVEYKKCSSLIKSNDIKPILTYLCK